MVLKSDFKLIGCRTNILDITFVASDQIDNVLTLATNVISSILVLQPTNQRLCSGALIWDFATTLLYFSQFHYVIP